MNYLEILIQSKKSMQLNYKVRLRRNVSETIEVLVALDPNTIMHKDPDTHWLSNYALEQAEEAARSLDWTRGDADDMECMGVFEMKKQ